MVTTVVNNPGLVAGMVLDWTNARTFTGKKGTGVITRGDVCVPDTALSPDGWKQAPASAPVYGPFAMCMKTTLSADTEIQLVKGGIWACTAGGTIEIGKLVQCDTATAGRVITDTPSDSTTALSAINWTRVIGVCLGFADNYDTTTPTAPVVGDLVAVEVRRP